MMNFGKNKPKPFVQAVSDFLEQSTTETYADDAAYINSIYVAINAIQTKVLFSEAVDDDKRHLSALLYAPERGRFLATGMQSAMLFSNAVEQTTLKVKTEIFGNSPRR